ncbi:MAG: ParB N-terminal domain-containing protein [Acidobacteriota bacterium]
MPQTLEFHQLDRRLAHLRARHPTRFRHLLASLAETGQQTPIVVIQQAARYLVIDGHQRIAALEQLRRDTVDAIVLDTVSEAEALLKVRSLRMNSEPETALEQGWLLAEMEVKLGYTVDELALRFDRSPTWVARRLSLVETLSESIQQQVRDGHIAPQIAMRYRAPAARIDSEQCEPMAQLFAQQHWTTRQAADFYNAWRNARGLARERILAEPDLFAKARQQRQPSSTTLEGDLNQIVAIARRAIARGEQTTPDSEVIHNKIQHAMRLLRQIEEQYAEPIATHDDFGVIRHGQEQARDRQDPQPVAPHRQRILELLPQCKGNLVRVHEELTAEGVTMSYTALTAFCRRHGIGRASAVPAGSYDHQCLPGVEMQHDTSPHEVTVDGRKYKAQTASAVLCYSRLLYFEIWPQFQRFDCKAFLTAALRYMDGAPQRVMIDNTHLVVLRGSGKQMEPVPEMAAFAERMGFPLVAHEIGDANRSARVERPFHFIEDNFLAGRMFASWQDLNGQARQWCDRVNATYKKHIRAIPRELYAVERLRLQSLPGWIPEVYRLHQRMVDHEAMYRCTRTGTRFRRTSSDAAWKCANRARRSRSNSTPAAL